ncbi:MAG: hypothetical protein K2X27_14055, partial [Candidatus Obscuribacterales bacterium]|nr:hypothetical protein [Candidatus Obscuribacterales bacterium]
MQNLIPDLHGYSYNPAMESGIEQASSEEIAAALAAVYMFCQEDKTAEFEEEAQKSLSAWGSASRLEAVNFSAGKIQAKSQVKNAMGWRQSFSRRWLSLSVGIFCALFLQNNAAEALERIQFDPTGKAASTALKAQESKVDAAPAQQAAQKAPKLAADEFYKSSGFIRIALNPNCSSAD